jgi:hypothetical protein
MAPLARRGWTAFDYLAVAYFATHIPTTLLIDAQTVLPEAAFPKSALTALDWHVAVNKDPFIGAASRPPWFRGIVWAELLLQVPLFVLLLVGWARCAAWVRLPVVIYGAHTATTLVPILAEIAAAPGLSDGERWKLVAIYIPYLLMPLALLWRAAARSDMFALPGGGAARQKAA